MRRMPELWKTLTRSCLLCLIQNTLPRIKTLATCSSLCFFVLPGELVFLWKFLFSSVQLFSHVQLFVTPWTAACQASLSITNSRAYSTSCPLSWWCHPTISSSVVPFSSCLQSFPAIRVLSNESVLRIRWPKYWNFSFSINPFNEYSGCISFRLDWLDLLALQGTLNSLIWHHSSKASVLRCSAFFIVQFSYPYMTTGKTIVLTRRTFVGKVMSLLFNTLSAAAAAKSLQSCPILCDLLDGSPPGSPVPGILQAGTLEWVAISFSSLWKWKVKVKLLSRVRLLATCPTLSDPMECSPPGSSVHGIFQARVA